MANYKLRRSNQLKILRICQEEDVCLYCHNVIHLVYFYIVIIIYVKIVYCSQNGIVAENIYHSINLCKNR